MYCKARRLFTTNFHHAVIFPLAHFYRNATTRLSIPKHSMLLYSWRFPAIHWLVHGHMASNNETVSRQMP